MQPMIRSWPAPSRLKGSYPGAPTPSRACDPAVLARRSALGLSPRPGPEREERGPVHGALPDRRFLE